jgi:hypothetical protein
VERDEDEHVTSIVETSWGSARWKCSCGASSSGQWSRSAEEAQKKAERHKVRAEAAASRSDRAGKQAADPLDPVREAYEAVEAIFLARLRQDGSREELAAAARAVHEAADAWQSKAWRWYFNRRDALGETHHDVIEVEIDAERSEMLSELWLDLASAYGDDPAQTDPLPTRQP